MSPHKQKRELSRNLGPEVDGDRSSYKKRKLALDDIDSTGGPSQRPSSPIAPIPSASLVVHGGPSWRGRRSLDNLVIFGDSYSADTVVDDAEEEVDELINHTWVGQFTRRLDIPSKNLHNYAIPGATAEEDVSRQVSRFLSERRKSDASGTALTSSESTYVLYFGINDCGRSDDSDELEAIVERLLDGVHQLYVNAQARNFILFDVPPIDRSPGAQDLHQTVEDSVNTWNASLKARLSAFAEETPNATVLLFSSHKVVLDVLDDPTEYDFTEDDTSEDSGAIWEDDIHLQPEVHTILADRLVSVLQLAPA